MILRLAFASSVVILALVVFALSLVGYGVYKAATWPDECLHTVIRKENCTR